LARGRNESMGNSEGGSTGAALRLELLERLDTTDAPPLSGGSEDLGSRDREHSRFAARSGLRDDVDIEWGSAVMDSVINREFTFEGACAD
jgi:hypothetical protein